MCLEQKLAPKYAYTKSKKQNRYTTKRPEKQIHTLKIKNELKFWYTKKQHLNKTLYKLHLKNSNEWKYLWDTISQNIDKKLELKMNKKYSTLNKKLKKLRETQTNDQEHNHNHTTHTFFKRTENLTDVTFKDEEMQLLNKGLKYNLHFRYKQWIQTLAIEADTAINTLPEKDQGYLRQLVANNIKLLINKQKTNKDQRTTTHTKRLHQEWNILKNIKHKIEQNQLVITKADKGNTLVIIHKDEYHNKIQEFINNNNFNKLPSDITNKVQKNIRTNINNCNLIIGKNNSWIYVNMNPQAPEIHGTIKLHKDNLPIRPIINWKNSPGYKLAQLVSSTLLPYSYPTHLT
jgi:hypothetical protein